MAQYNPNDYETVDSRVKRFYTDHPGGRITTALVDMDGEPGRTRWVVRASIWRDRIDGEPDGTGLAFEVDGTGMANKTSALENCETSAVGRALANIGYSGDRRASREEMAKTVQQPQPKPAPADWREQVGKLTTREAIQAFYEAANAAGWWSQEVNAACLARVKELANANA